LTRNSYQVYENDGGEGDVSRDEKSEEECDDDEGRVGGAEGHAQNRDAAQQDGEVRHEQRVHPREVGKPADYNSS